MSTDTKRAWASGVRRVVVKIGSRALVDERNRLDEEQVARLVEQMAGVRAGGRDVICVSSGAIAAGLGEMGLERRPGPLPAQQAAAAIGQARLVSLYRELFARHDLHIGQVLLSHGDLHSRDRHLNARNTIGHLLREGIVPIVNENDTVAVEEIRFGDNDVLSALVAMLVRADALILLTTVDGFLDDAPRNGGRLISSVNAVTRELRELAGGSDSSIGRGGMRTKLEAAEMVTRAGEHCVIANGRHDDVLPRILAGEELGTAFNPVDRRMAGRKRWIAFFDHPRGELHVDGGAAAALRDQGRSLLAIGMTGVVGSFDRGAPVRILDPEGREIGRGLVNYGADELQSITGLRSDQIVEVLGACEYEEVVHRDNLALK